MKKALLLTLAALGLQSANAQISYPKGSLTYGTSVTTQLGTIKFDTNAWATSRGAVQAYDGTANTFLVGALASDTPSNGQIPTWNTGGTVTWESPGAGSVLWNGVGDPDGNNSVSLGNWTSIFLSTLDSGVVYEISDTDADAAAATTLLKLSHDDGADTDVTYLSMIGDKNGTPTNDYLFTQARLTATLPFTTTDYTSTGQTFYINSAQTVFWKAGTGSPEAAVTGGIGSLWSRTDGTTDTALYRKETGAGNTGWVAVAAGGGSSSLTSTYVGYGSGANALTGEAALTYDATTNTFTAGTFAGAGGGLTLDASGFNGNLATTDNTLQEIAQKFDDLAVGSGAVATDTIWDAAGDLAVGSGANTAVKLSLGTANQLLAVNGAGTALAYTSDPVVTSVDVTGNATIGGLVFEGTTVDVNDTTLTVIDPTGTRTATLPNADTYIPVIPQILTFTGPTAARTITLPDAAFTVARTDAANTFTGVQTMTSPVVNTSMELGHATQNTLTASAGTLSVEGVAVVTTSSTDTLTNKTLDASATGNVLKQFGYLVLTHPHVFGSGVTQQTTVTANTYGQALFANATDKATNYVEYYCVIPPDIDTAVDLTATLKFKLGGADTGDHEYEITFDSVAASAPAAGTLADAISLAYTADASGADNDSEQAGETTLTGWRSAMTAGNLFVIRVARDGDHASDTSTVNSYSGPLVIKYGITQ